MRIKSLQVHGFKSFVDRTVFSFPEGITAVVGPNGCGKSNVVDAIRWVMGEQSPKRLRGKGMDDVIFAGSENRPPIGMAEVVLEFDNSDGRAPAEFADYSEIQITRRLYRSGESEYLLNKVPCRLRDVHDFFRDTGIGVKGYTIVEQGRIGEIVSAKADERRVLIEEAAGISKYKARRKEAESKIQSTEQNLTRVNDVLGEIRRQISTLERQARKAARYKRLRETQRVLELSIAYDERKALLEKVEAARGELTELRDGSAALESQQAQIELSAQEKRLALAEAEKEVTRGAERLYSLRSEIKQLEGQIDLARREREGLAVGNESRRGELTQLAERRTAAEAEAQRAAEDLDRLERALATDQQAEREAETASRETAEQLRTLEQQREAANQALVGVLTTIARSEDRLAAAADRGSELDARLRSADRDLEVSQSQATVAGRDQNELEQGLRNLLAERDRFQEQLIEAMNAHTAAVGAEQRSSEALRGVREKHEARRARLDSLQEVLARREDLGEGTRALLDRGDEAAQRFGLKGLVREVLEADPEVEAAVEAVLAERAEALVVDSPQGAAAAIAELRSNRSGRGVFVFEPPADVSGGIVPLGVPLYDRVRAKQGFETLARNLLQGVYLVDSLEEALARFTSVRLPATFVTAAGDLLSPDGLIRGGGASAGGGTLARAREVRELATEVANLEAEVAQCESRRAQAEQARQRASDALDNLRNRHHTAALAVANHEKDLERSRERVKALGEAQEGRVAERAELLAESESLSEERERLEQVLEDARAERATRQRELDAIGLRISSTAREVTRLESRVAELRTVREGRSESRARAEDVATRAQNAVRESTAWIERREREIREADERQQLLVQQVAQAEESLAAKLVEEEAARVHGEEIRARYESGADEVRALDERLRGLRDELGSSRDQAGHAELALRESELALSHQSESVRERWNVDIADWVPPRLEDIEAAEAEGAPTEDATASEAGASDDGGEGDDLDGVDAVKEARANAALVKLPLEQRHAKLEDVRQRVGSIGEVNLGAIEEHEELAERFRFLSEQKDDLEATIGSLREAIARINRTSRRLFRETFESVSKRFSENFPRLFGGGKASLMLTEAEDILEAGIEIMAMPPGKRLQNVNLLSGGEKTMTALALLVAVFQVRPSPFFLLDEVDAALDDANVGRFNQLITEMVVDSQFLVITHNKRTIEVADLLYGVTMEQKGVSKLVSVALH